MTRRQRKHLQCNLILIQNNRLVRQDRPTTAGQRQISASRWAFPLRPDGGRKDCKVSRVVEMEWASRVTVTRTVARSLDRRIGGPGTACKHPRGDHPSPTGSCDPGLTWANTLNRARMVTCL